MAPCISPTLLLTISLQGAMAFLLFVAFVLKHSIEKHFDISLLEHMSMNNLHVLVHQFYKYQLNPFDFSLIKNSISDRT